MRKVICAVLAFLLCVSLALPAFAFTPSVTVQTTIEIVPVPGNGTEEVQAVIFTGERQFVEVKDDCLLLTSVAEAMEENSELEKVDKEAHTQLLEVYKELDSGKMEIPYADFDLKADKMVVRDLFDATFLCAGKAEDDHDAILAQDNAFMDVTLDLGVGRNDKVHIFVYTENADGKMEWIEVDAINNGDGTVTVTFTALGVVAVCIEQ